MIHVSSPVSSLQVDLSGYGRHMGMDVVWQLKLRPDGAFLEKVSGKELSFSWGCSGGAKPSSWEVLGFCLQPTTSCGGLLVCDFASVHR